MTPRLRDGDLSVETGVAVAPRAPRGESEGRRVVRALERRCPRIVSARIRLRRGCATGIVRGDWTKTWRRTRARLRYASALGEPCGFALDLILAHACGPLTPRDALDLSESALARRVGAETAAGLKQALAAGAAAEGLSSEAAADQAYDDGLLIAEALAGAVLRDGYDAPVVDAEALKRVRTPALRHAAAHANELILEARDRCGEVSEAKPPAWLLLGELAVAACRRASKPDEAASPREKRLCCAFAATLARALARALPRRNQPAKDIPRDALIPTAKPWDAPTFLDDERKRYRGSAHRDHGTIVNPITGEDLDVMDQCVGLHVEARDKKFADAAAFEDALAAFSSQVALGARVFVRRGDRDRAGDVCRVNGDGTYDVKPADEDGRTLRDVPRRDVAGEPLLVVGDPAGGKTTFAKQLLTWTMRSDTHTYGAGVDIFTRRSPFRLILAAAASVLFTDIATLVVPPGVFHLAGT